MYLVYVPLRGRICQTSASRKRKSKYEKCFYLRLVTIAAMFACRRRSSLILFHTLVLLYFLAVRKRGPCSFGILGRAKMATGAKGHSLAKTYALRFLKTAALAKRSYCAHGFGVAYDGTSPSGSLRNSENAYRRRIFLIMGRFITLAYAKTPLTHEATSNGLAKSDGPIILQGFKIANSKCSPFGSICYGRIESACRRRTFLMDWISLASRQSIAKSRIRGIIRILLAS